jgi:DNA-binding GntR family transcriptional regulator
MYLPSKEAKIALRQRIEARIVEQIVDDALKAGYTLSVDDGGDALAVKDSTSRKDVLDALMNTDEDRLILTREDHRGAILLVYGNSGWDVIADYSVRLEDVLAGANALAEKLEAEAR